MLQKRWFFQNINQSGIPQILPALTRLSWALVLAYCSMFLVSDLSRKVRAFVANMRVKNRKPLLNRDQERLVYGKNYSHFDISLLYILLRYIYSSQPHRNGWGNVPFQDDRSLSANIERIRIIRNEHCLNISIVHFSNLEFERKWTNICQIVKDIERYLGTYFKK